MALQVEEIGGFSPSFSRKMAKLLCKPDILAPRIFQKNFERRKLSVKAQILKSQHVNQDRKRIEHNYMLREFEKFQIVNNSLTESKETEMIPYANYISKKKTNDAPSPKSPKKKPKRKLPGAAALSKFLSQPMVELAEALLVVFSTLFVAIDTLDSLAPSILHVVESAGDIVAYIFFIIFGLRWYADAEQGPKYFAKPFVLVDMVVVILPIFLQILNHEGWWGGLPSFLMSQDGGLITLRLLRILRLQRVLTSMEHFANFQRALGVTNPTDVQPYKLQLARVILSVSTLLSVAAGLIYTTEHRVNPALPDYFSALYFGLTTITTVGFGYVSCG
jgi:Ion transport protein